MNEKKITRIIAKKTSLYFKFSMILFVVSLILLSTAFLFVLQQYIQLNNDFVDNANTHIIKIIQKTEQGTNNTHSLCFSDETEIQDIVRNIQDCYTYNEYSIGFGMSDEEGNIYFVKGVDNEILERFGMTEINLNEAIVHPQDQNKKIMLNIPYINIESGGFTSNAVSKMEMRLIPAKAEISLLDEFDTSPDTIFVNTDTLQKILFAMFGDTWEDFRINYDSVNPYGMELIESIRVYVDDLEYVKKAAKALTANGYEVSYVLGAFEDLQRSLAKTYMIYGALMLLILVISAVNIIISFKGYLSSMRKDMGIFRHYGYSVKSVYHIYGRLIIKPYIKIVVSMAIYILVLSIVLLQEYFVRAFLGAFFMMLLFVGIVMILLLKSLSAMCQKDILILLRRSKEVE